MPHRQRDGKIETLRKVPALAALPPSDLKRLAALADVVDLSEGKVLMKEGRRGDEAFLILEGEVGVSRGGEEIGRLGPGEFVGEMALLDNRPRSATVVATVPSRALSFSVHAFGQMEHSSKALAQRVLRQLAQRLRPDPAAAVD